MTKLSPAAQIVLDAFRTSHTGQGCLAAALRAAVNEVAPEKTIEDISYVHQSYVDGYKDALYEILIIANEIELQQSNPSMTDITFYKLDAAFASLKKFDHLAKDDDFIEVVLWNNGEGFDAHLSAHGDQSFKLTWGEFKALKKLVKELDK